MQAKRRVNVRAAPVRLLLTSLTAGLVVALGVPPASDDARGQTSYVEKKCGHVTAQARNLRTFGYNGHRPLRCRTGRKVTRRWIARDCRRSPGDTCRFEYLGKRWHCTVGTFKGKRVVGCNDGKTVGLSFFWRQ
jgi:hypothetical protein